MRYLISIGHPSQFHLFRRLIHSLKTLDHEVIVLITEKDLLQELFAEYNIKYDQILQSRKGSSNVKLLFAFIKRFYEIFKIIRAKKPDLLVGSEVTFPLLGKLFGVASILLSEDDSVIIPQYAKIAFPFATAIISPKKCNAGKWESKKTGYDGYQKLVYLHPNTFIADKSNISKIIESRFFLFRFSRLDAYHDKNINGIDFSIMKKLIQILEPHGKIYISSERKLEPEFEKYRIKIKLSEMHSVLYYTDLFIGDSQSMAVEASILGTPNIRFSDFVGRIGVLDELEHVYHLTYGFKINQTIKMLEKVNEIVSNNNSKDEFISNHNKMLNEKIDVFRFFEWYLLNFPNSKNILKVNPDYQFNFK